MVDADLTYDFREIPSFVRELDDGAELVVGNRMSGVQPGAMPWLSRVGNPVLSGFLNALHRTNIGDAHCGMRALRRSILPTLNLRTVGMEFASEMVIRATRERLDVRRSRSSSIRVWASRSSRRSATAGAISVSSSSTTRRSSSSFRARRCSPSER